jgi:hypothetical protein
MVHCRQACIQIQLETSCHLYLFFPKLCLLFLVSCKSFFLLADVKQFDYDLSWLGLLCNSDA